MNRRDFLSYLTFIGSTTFLGRQKAFGGWLPKERRGTLPDGMVIDVAHAHFATLEDITDIAFSHGFPVIDSHTSLSPFDQPRGDRLRTWEEMEMVARTGGVVCTWPLRVQNPSAGYERLTILDWAKENHLRSIG